MKLGPTTGMMQLVQETADSDEITRERAVAALEDCGPPEVTDAAALAELLTDTRPDVAYWAATLLGRLQTAATPQTGGLITALQSHTLLAVRERAAWALGQIGAGADNATVALEQAAASEHVRLARLAREALARIQA